MFDVVVDFLDSFIDRLADARLFFAKAGKQLLQHGLVAMTGELHGAFVGLGRGQAREGRCQKVQRVRRGKRGTAAQRPRNGARRHGKALVEIGDDELGTFARNLDLAAFERAAVLVAQHGHKDLVAQLFFRRVPIDVEEGGEAAGGAIFQHIPPHAVFAVHRHVVRHNVEHLAQAKFAQML